MGQITWNFTGKKALVTGGSRGIGREIVKKLAHAGADVVFTYRNREEEALSIIRELEENNIYKVSSIQCDFSNNDQIDYLLQYLNNKLGIKKLDYIVNNAGTLTGNSLFNMSLEDWNLVMQVNLTASFSIIKGLLKPIARAKGSIVNISSTSGIAASPGEVNYTTSKAGLIGLTNALSKELASLGVRVNAIAPGPTDTDMQIEEQKEMISSDIPLKRLGKPEEVAHLVLYLLSDEASYITGEIIKVDGGFKAYAPPQFL